ncbi:Ankyrin repeats (3 copies) [Posidoniimonas polymericola]|uniref:Ankyrin repeats (3 copies) n=1 Tax=Posidoniimonas polymericola TaxID=2528002 RepID=A0A5C5YSL9_9BACT|nr:ankyrin repeat domain-containing protein [Posidoniimonas polymericola]TWT77908.1 Ankyrin repeats (3 copies) [Posidoniimonas polymericola]
MGNLPLQHAASIGDVSAVKSLIAAGHDINEQGEPLSKQELKSLGGLLSEASVKYAAEAIGRPYDNTPLMAAISEGHFEVANLLLDAGANVNLADSLRQTPLMLAIRWKHVELAERLIAAGADLDAKDAAGAPILTQAIDKHAWEIINRLLDAGSNPDPPAKTLSIPIIAAAIIDSAEALPLIASLLDLGAKPHNSLPLAKAIEHHDMPLVVRLVELGSPLTAALWSSDSLHVAAWHDNYQAARYLLRLGMGVSEVDGESGLLSLLVSKDQDQSEVVSMAEEFLAAGTRVDHRSREGQTALHSAVSYGKPYFVRWLLEHGANVNHCDGYRTPLDVALSQRDQHEDILARAKRDKTRFAEAFENSSSELNRISPIIEILEEFGARRADESMQSSGEGNPVLATPLAERRGLCDATFFKAHQVLIKADIDKVAAMLQKDRGFERVERDALSRGDDLPRPTADVLALVKLKGQPWVYATGRRPRGDSPMMKWSKKLRGPVLHAGEESVSGVVYYALYDRGECVEAFESDGQWFHGGVEIDPEVHDESDRMQGTSFSSLLRDEEQIDWSDYESEWEFLDRFLREQDAYLTFIQAIFPADGTPLEVHAYNPDEEATDAIERVDLAYYKPTEAEARAAKAIAEADKRGGVVDPLLEAIHENDLEAARAAIEAGVVLNDLPIQSNDSYLEISLKYAIINRSQSIVDMLIDRGADPNFGGRDRPLPALMSLPNRDSLHMQMVLKLLASGADVDSRTPPGNANPFIPSAQSALHKAAQNNWPHYAKLLLRHGADIELRDDYDRSPLDTARARLKQVKMDRLKDVPCFTHALDEQLAQEVVDLLQAAERGELDISTLPSDGELLAAEEQLQQQLRAD